MNLSLFYQMQKMNKSRVLSRILCLSRLCHQLFLRPPLTLGAQATAVQWMATNRMCAHWLVTLIPTEDENFRLTSKKFHGCPHDRNGAFNSVHWEHTITQIYYELSNAFQFISNYSSQWHLFSSEKIVHFYPRHINSFYRQGLVANGLWAFAITWWSPRISGPLGQAATWFFHQLWGWGHSCWEAGVLARTLLSGHPPRPFLEKVICFSSIKVSLAQAIFPNIP